MRILMLVTHPNIKGPIPKITPHLVSALRSLGCTVVVEPWGRHHDAESLSSKVLGRAQDIARIRRTLSRVTFDVMVVHTAHDWLTLLRDVPLLLVTRRCCPLVVLQLHGSQPDVLLGRGHLAFRILSAWLVRMSDAVMLLSSEERLEWQQFYPAGKFLVVNNPFVPASFDTTATLTRPWNVPSGVPVLLFVGRLISEKGIFDLLEAVAWLKGRVPCHLLVVGSGAEAKQVTEQVLRLGLHDWVTLTGYLDRDRLIEAYQASDVFVLPSWNEGFPTVIAEAMSVGLPIVTTRIGGAADHLREGIHACFVPRRDPGTLSETLIRLLADPILRAKMAQANREKVKEFAPETVGRHYLGALEEIASVKRSLSDRRELPV